MTIEEKVREVVCSQLDVDPDKVVAVASIIDDLGADSLSVVELVLALEEKFEIEIPESDTEKLRTFQDAVAYIESKVA